MPHVHVTVTGKHTREWKQDLMVFAAATIHANTSTPLKNVYVYIHEMDPENVRKTAPHRAHRLDDYPGSYPAGEKRHHDGADRQAGGDHRRE